MIANDNKFYLTYSNKLVYQHDNTYDYSINRKTYSCWFDYSDWTEKIEANPKAPKFQVKDLGRITKY